MREVAEVEGSSRSSSKANSASGKDGNQTLFFLSYIFFLPTTPSLLQLLRTTLTRSSSLILFFNSLHTR